MLYDSEQTVYNGRFVKLFCDLPLERTPRRLPKQNMAARQKGVTPTSLPHKQYST
jgi:hypothetical protein